MSTYLLLRNNKESGPYHLQQLKEMGLKAYDLIWVEGRSAAWRYPGEVEELKEFAPIVEEQPFDRFYKKPEENKEKHFHEIVEEAERIKSEKIKTSPKPVISKKQNKPAEKIFVLLPEKKKTSVIPEKTNEITNEKRFKKTDDIIQTEAPDLVHEKVESSLNELKSRYTKTYQSRNQKNIRKRNTKKILEYAVAALFVLTLGTLIFLNFKPRDNKPIVNFSPAKNNLHISNPIPVQADKNEQDLAANIVPGQTEVEQPREINKPIHEEKKNTASKKSDVNENSVPAANAIQSEPSYADDDGQRKKSIRDDTSPFNKKPVNISSLVSVKANEYKRRAFGGIQNLELTVNNSSNFILDKVIVELQYLKPSEQPLITEKIEFTTVSPNSALTLKIPDNPRGIKILYKITQIESAQFEKDTAGL
jgi:hypothetical protein